MSGTRRTEEEWRAIHAKVVEAKKQGIFASEVLAELGIRHNVYWHNRKRYNLDKTSRAPYGSKVKPKFIEFKAPDEAKLELKVKGYTVVCGDAAQLISLINYLEANK